MYSQSTSIMQTDYYTYHIHPYTWELIDSPGLLPGQVAGAAT